MKPHSRKFHFGYRFCSVVAKGFKVPAVNTAKLQATQNRLCIAIRSEKFALHGRVDFWRVSILGHEPIQEPSSASALFCSAKRAPSATFWKSLLLHFFNSRWLRGRAVMRSGSPQQAFEMKKRGWKLLHDKAANLPECVTCPSRPFLPMLISFQCKLSFSSQFSAVQVSADSWKRC